LKSYYELLGVKENCSIEELRSAYRRKAKEVHPDRNKQANAHQQFLYLQQAFDYLENQKLTNKTVDYDGWMHKAAHIVREQAAASHPEIKETPASKFDKKAVLLINELVDYSLYFFAFGVLTFRLIYLLLNYEQTTVFSIAMYLLVFLPIGIWIIKATGPISIPRVVACYKEAILSTSFLVFVTTVLNFILFFKIGFRTLIPISGIFLAYLLIVAAIYLLMRFSKLIKTHFNSLIVLFCFAPLVMGSLLAINYFIHFNTTVESYSCYSVANNSANGRGQRSTLIELEDKKYQEYLGLRFFYNLRDIKSNRINYTFADGILGFRVMTHYEFVIDANDPLITE